MPYPRGRWRLASLEELDRVSLWFSHILIRYDEVLDPNVSFSRVDWTASDPAPQRSRDEALALAQRVAAEAAANPESFSDLVSTYSEDQRTRERGGSLGGMAASWLVAWGQIVDALAVLKPGETSEVVETPFGFHVLRRQAPPPEQIVSGSRIVIGYDDAPALTYFHQRGPRQHRSRADASALAHELYERARRHPLEFTALVERYSEHVDAEVGGDIGAWSTREPLAPTVELDALAQLQVGGVAPPVDTFLGMQILMRTAARERQEFAHDGVEVFFDPRAPAGDPDSEAVRREQALEIAQSIHRSPAMFDTFRRDFCCLEAQRWREGRREKSIQAGLSLLQLGEIGSSPVRTVSSYLIMRRLDPETIEPPPAVRLELPSDIAPDVDSFLGQRLDQASAEEVVRRLGPLAADALSLEGERRTRLLTLHEFRAGLGATTDERVSAVAQLARETATLLTSAEQQQYRALAVQLLEQALL
ncbi:MAG TPA: peptidylprolyl isomerase [Polyangiaceae bacterium]|nr:peptidylprolyl isomerase [Polyangiaceae bacterium]